MTTWAVIYNPTSGSFSEKKLEAALRIWREGGVETRVYPSRYAGHVTILAREISGVERVVAHGGDGTLNEVANGVMGRGLPLVFLPGGTANSMAWEIGMPRDAVRAAKVLLNGRPVPVFPGEVGGRVFLLMAGFGFDGTVVYLVTKRLKSWLGPASYLVTGVRALFHPKPEVRVVTPGGPLAGHWVVAARARRYAGMFKVHPRAGLLKPELGLVVVSKAMIAPFSLSNLAFGTRFTAPGMALEDHARFRIEADQPLHLHVDGDYVGRRMEFEVGIARQAIPFCFPAGHPALSEG